MVCLSRPYSFKFFKGCYSQILFGPFLNILSQIYQDTSNNKAYKEYHEFNSFMTEVTII